MDHSFHTCENGLCGRIPAMFEQFLLILDDDLLAAARQFADLISGWFL
jgi:hypothetical protein